MTFKKVNNWLHLWLGLGSGIIVFIVCITGCIWVFNEEIEALLAPETLIEKQEKTVLLPSQLGIIAKGLYPDKAVSYVTYQQGRAVNVGIGGRRGGGATLKVNPYTGEVISIVQRKKGDVDFFRFILNGHRFLWLPFEIGRPIVNYGTLIFVVLLITGLIWWYPKKWNKKTTEKSFKIKWGGSFKRVNLDLHNVLGFYSLLFLLAIALTGMVYGIKWYSESMYWATSGGQSLGEFSQLKSDSLQANKFYTPEKAIDKAFLFAMKENPKAEGFYYTFADTSKAKSVISVTVYPTAGQFYNNKSYRFDQHTLQQLKGNHPVYDTDYAEADFGGKLRKMNYDIHVGSILGFPGKVLAFLVTLIGASLPVTGFLVWWGRKFGKNKLVETPPQTNFSATSPGAVPIKFVPKSIPKKLHKKNFQDYKAQQTKSKSNTMNNLKSILLTLLLIATSSQLFAHALWIETKTTGKIGISQEVKIFYGEYLSNERDLVSKWYSDVKTFSLWLTAPGQEKIKLNTTAGTNFYSASFTPESDGVYILSIVHEAKELGGTTKYEFSSLATVAVGEPTAIDATVIPNLLQALVTDVKIYKANMPVKIKAVLDGKSIAEKSVSVFSPEGWTKEYKTDANGLFEFSPLWPGRYVLEVSNYENATGEHHGKTYTATWHGATSSFEVVK